MNNVLSVISYLVMLNGAYFLYQILTTLRHFPPPRRLKPEFQKNMPFVSILIPARNEARNIERCVRSLLALDYPHYEVVAIDDRSSDRTLEILRQLETETTRLKVLSIKESREGGSGKSYALSCAVQQAQGEWFLFSDADTIHASRSLRLAIQEAREHGVDFVSFFSRMVCPGFWEALIQPTASALVSVWHPIDALNDPANPIAFANGQYLLMERGAYQKIGGHDAIKERIMEDVALCEKAKGMGIPIRISIGTHAVKTCMYHGFHESWRGWKRLFVLIAHRKTHRLLWQALGLFCIGVVPFLSVMTAVIFHASAYTCHLAGLAFMLSIVVWLTFSVFSRQPRWPTVLLPLSASLVIGILLHAAWDALTGRSIEWRGMRYGP